MSSDPPLPTPTLSLSLSLVPGVYVDGQCCKTIRGRLVRFGHARSILVSPLSGTKKNLISHRNTISYTFSHCLRHLLNYPPNPTFIIRSSINQTARTHALTASATAIFNHKTQRAKALLEAAAVKANVKANNPSSPPSLSSWGLVPISATLSNMTNWLSSAYQHATTTPIKSNNSTKVPTPSLWQSLFVQLSPSPKANQPKPSPSPANKPTLWSYLTRLGTWILTPIRSMLSSLSKGVKQMLQYIQQALQTIVAALSTIPRKVVSVVSWILSGPRKVVSGVVWLVGTVMSGVGQALHTVYRSVGQYLHGMMRDLRALVTTYPGTYLVGVKKMYAMLQTVPGRVVKGRGWTTSTLSSLLSLIFIRFLNTCPLYSPSLQACNRCDHTCRPTATSPCYYLSCSPPCRV